MKKTTTLTLRLAAAFVALTAQLSLHAQETGSLVGYVNAYVRAQAYPADAGTINLKAPGSKALEIYRSTFDFKGVLPVADILSQAVTYLQAKAKAQEGYIFVGWYVDTDGDGQYDGTKDEFFDPETETVPFFTAATFNGGNDEVYPQTEAEAKAVALPAEPQETIFAVFSKGAFAMNEDGMDACGDVAMSKPANSPGDEVTISATPREGYVFEYWKSVRGSQLLSDDKESFIVSRDNPYTFTVKGGERLYAYYRATGAPEVAEFPAEGAWRVCTFDAPWVLHEQSQALVYVFNAGDLQNQGGKALLNSADEEAKYDVTQDGVHGEPTLIYGRGKVNFAYKENLYFSRHGSLLKWSGDKGLSVKDAGNANAYHVYAFSEQLQAFIEIGTTDLQANPLAAAAVDVPARTCYFALSAYDMMNLMDPQTGEIPKVIAFSAEGYDRGVAGYEEAISLITGIDSPKAATRQFPGGQKVYTLTGVEVKATSQPGIYIVNGRKVSVR